MGGLDVLERTVDPSVLAWLGDFPGVVEGDDAVRFQPGQHEVELRHHIVKKVRAVQERKPEHAGVDKRLGQHFLGVALEQGDACAEAGGLDIVPGDGHVFRLQFDAHDTARAPAVHQCLGQHEGCCALVRAGFYD